MEESRIDASMTGGRFPGPYGESSTDIKHQLIRDPLKKVREVQAAIRTFDCEGWGRGRTQTQQYTKRVFMRWEGSAGDQRSAKGLRVMLGQTLAQDSPGDSSRP